MKNKKTKSDAFKQRERCSNPLLTPPQTSLINNDYNLLRGYYLLYIERMDSAALSRRIMKVSYHPIGLFTVYILFLVVKGKVQIFVDDEIVLP